MLDADGIVCPVPASDSMSLAVPGPYLYGLAVLGYTGLYTTLRWYECGVSLRAWLLLLKTRYRMVVMSLWRDAL
jgi:hypothetical protein